MWCSSAPEARASLIETCSYQRSPFTQPPQPFPNHPCLSAYYVRCCLVAVARYGVLIPSKGIALRGLFIINPQGVVQQVGGARQGQVAAGAAASSGSSSSGSSSSRQGLRIPPPLYALLCMPLCPNRQRGSISNRCKHCFTPLLFVEQPFRLTLCVCTLLLLAPCSTLPCPWSHAQVTVNDLPIGRSVDETLRLLQAIQYHAEHGEVCPAGWKPGDRAMVPGEEPLGGREGGCSVLPACRM